jgi:hypothetical protein
MFIEMLWLMFAAFICGLACGVLVKGIHIHMHDKSNEAPKEYNETLEDELPVEHQQYIKQTKGFVE